ncbi:MAG: hypothetical protein QOH58_1384 [Thermoleophilaceae bacterium]|jgi:hypothetical protein|nr:hypothetical protein [Thermoleophilaceae bacterium]
MELQAQEPRRIWWARPRKLCALERPGGGGRNHRIDRRAAEIEHLRGRGVKLFVSVMRTRHNLGAYDAAGIEWHHVPVARTEDAAAQLEELLPLLRRELRSAGAVAVHGDSWTDFPAALCAAHLHEARGADPPAALAQAACAGLTVTPAACALLGVEPKEVEAFMRVS